MIATIKALIAQLLTTNFPPPKQAPPASFPPTSSSELRPHDPHSETNPSTPINLIRSEDNESQPMKSISWT